MNFKNGILIVAMLALMTSCGESVEERAWREYEEEVDKFSKEWDKEMEKLDKELEREMRELEREMNSW